MSRLTKNIVYNIAGKVFLFAFGILLGLFSVKYTFEQLGEEALGIIYFIATIDDVLLASLRKGVSSSAVREVSGHFENDPDYVREFIQAWSLICWVTFLVLSVVAFYLAPVIVQEWLVIKKMDPATAIYVVRIMSIAGLLALPRSFYQSLIIGVQRMEFTNIIAVAGAMIQRLGIILIILNGARLYHVIYWLASYYFLETLASFVFSAKFFELRSFIPRYSAKVLMKNIRFALSMTWISVLSMIQKQADKIMLSKFLPIGAMGFYIFAFNNISRCNLLTTSISQAAFPSLCEKFKSGNREELTMQFKKLQSFVCFISVPIFAAIPFGAMPVFSFVFNENVAKTLMLPATLLTLGFYMESTLTIPYQLSLAVGRPDIAVKQSLYSLLAVLPLIIVLIYFFELKGAALGCVLYFSVGYLYTVPRICNECIDKPLWFFYGDMVVVALSIGMTYGIAWLVLEVMGKRSIFSLCVSYLAATFVFLIISYFFVDQEVRKGILRYASSVRNRLTGNSLVAIGEEGESF